MLPKKLVSSPLISNMRLYGFQYLKYEYLISSFGETLTKELTAKIIAGKKNNKYVITIFFIIIGGFHIFDNILKD